MDLSLNIYPEFYEKSEINKVSIISNINSNILHYAGNVKNCGFNMIFS